MPTKKNIMIENFLKNYDKNNNYNFDTCKYRPGASFTAGFGLDNTFKKLRLHAAIDRGYSKFSIYNIYAPFDIENAYYIGNYGTYGSLLFLPVKDADFELRIAHTKINELAPYFQNYINKNEKFNISAGERIGDAGNLGLSVGIEIIPGKAGAHTHTEIASKGISSSVLDYILEQKVNKDILETPYTDAELISYAKNNGLNPDTILEDFIEDKKKRNITFINDYKCIRRDYHTKKIKTFYNSKILFIM